jgi:lipopolysaccharide transport system ATP-binding protein
MQVRLAFAVAAHVQSDILLVDEVLAVGDAAFQKRCLSTMDQATRSGRTVLFVSHHLAAVSSLCSEVLWLDHGQARLLADPTTVIGAYLRESSAGIAERVWDDAENPGRSKLRLRAVRICAADGRVTANLPVDLPGQLEIEYEVVRELPACMIGFQLTSATGAIAFTSFDAPDGMPGRASRRPGVYTSACTLPANFLNVGEYRVTILADVFSEMLLNEADVVSFWVEATGGLHARIDEARYLGVVCPALEWTVKPA